MNGFIEVHNAKTNKVNLINVKYIQSIEDNKIAMYDGCCDVEWVVETTETYKEIKHLIIDATR